MFKIKKDFTYPWPVRVKYPDPEKPGHFVEETFTGLFNEQDTEQSKARTEEFLANRNLDLGVELLKDVWAGWPEGEVQDHDGKPLVNDGANRTRLLRSPYVLKAVSEAFKESNSPEGKKTRTVKN